MPSTDRRAPAPPTPDERSEPSLSVAPTRSSPRLRLTDSPPPRPGQAARGELRAGERLIVESAPAAAPDRGGMLAKAAWLAVILLAVVGAATLIRHFVGL